jgi:hypothetical protein
VVRADANGGAIRQSNLDGSGLRTFIEDNPFGIAFAEGIVVPIPEPSNWVLLSTGMFALAIALARWSRGREKVLVPRLGNPPNLAL